MSLNIPTREKNGVVKPTKAVILVRLDIWKFLFSTDDQLGRRTIERNEIQASVS